MYLTRRIMHYSAWLFGANLLGDSNLIIYDERSPKSLSSNDKQFHSKKCRKIDYETKWLMEIQNHCTSTVFDGIFAWIENQKKSINVPFQWYSVFAVHHNFRIRHIYSPYAQWIYYSNERNENHSLISQYIFRYLPSRIVYKIHIYIKSDFKPNRQTFVSRFIALALTKHW